MSTSGGVKSFVSEAEADDIRKKRQEEWEKIRQPEDPIERPEEVVDNRTLYEKLQEQKDKKQEEWEEQHKLKNMIRGLESEETEFLDLVAKQQHQINKQRYDEENKEVKDFRSAVSDLQSASLPKQSLKRASQAPGKKSQTDLIAGAIKRRKSSGSSETSPEKKSKSTLEELQERSDNTGQPVSVPIGDDCQPTSIDDADNTETKQQYHKVFVPRCCVERTGPNRRQTLTIPGMGIYSDSSDSESSSSDSEIISTTAYIRYQ